MPWGRDSIYILGASATPDEYILCGLKVNLTPNCSTQYNASASGSTLEAICEDPNDDLRYIKSLTNATSGNVSISRDWVNIGSTWADSRQHLHLV